MSEYGQSIDRAELEEARLMAMIGGQKPKQVVIHTKSVDGGPISPRNPTSPRVHHPTVVTTHHAPVNSIPVNRQPEKTEPTVYKPVEVSSDTRPSGN
jgi:hypothetical protein